MKVEEELIQAGKRGVGPSREKTQTVQGSEQLGAPWEVSRRQEGCGGARTCCRERSLSLTWELVRNAGSQDPAQAQ